MCRSEPHWNHHTSSHHSIFRWAPVPGRWKRLGCETTRWLNSPAAIGVSTHLAIWMQNLDESCIAETMPHFGLLFDKVSSLWKFMKRSIEFCYQKLEVEMPVTSSKRLRGIGDLEAMGSYGVYWVIGGLVVGSATGIRTSTSLGTVVILSW